MGSARKTGSFDQAWVVLDRHGRPPAVEDHYRYWSDPPPVRSPRCAYWLRQIERGWLPNRHWRNDGYDASSERFGVYIWEYLHVLAPAIADRMRQLRADRG